MIIILLLAFSSPARSEMEGFIVGGKQTSIRQWQFITFIEVWSVADNMTVSACGGSLLSSQTVLTAAHCLDDVTNNKLYMNNKYQFIIFMGHSMYEKARISRRVKDYETPSAYDPDREDVRSDIGVMFLYTPVKFVKNVKKVILFNQKFSPTRDKNLIVGGWGKTNTDDEPHMSPTIKDVKVKAISSKICSRYVPLIDVNSVVCAEGSKAYAYSGDSGGPLVKRGSKFQIGIVSFRHEVSGVTVYTSVPEHYDWIRKTQLKLFKKHCG